MENYKKLLVFLKGYEKLFLLAFILMLFASFFQGIELPMVVPIVDTVLTGRDIVLPYEDRLPGFILKFVKFLNESEPRMILSYVPAFIIVATILKHMLIFFYSYVMNKISQQVMRDVRSKLYSKIQHLSLDYFSQKRTGELISRITNDVNVIENAVSYAVIDLFRQPMMIIIYLTIPLVIDPKTTLIIFILGPAIGYPIARIGKKLKKLSLNVQEKMADMNSFLLETISGVQVVKAFSNEEYEINRFIKINFDYFKLRMKSIKRILLISPISEVFGAIAAAFVLIKLGDRVINNELSAGVLFLFIGSIVSIISPIKKLGNVNALIQQALAANTRIYNILDEEIKVKEASQSKPIEGFNDKIVIDNVNFHYGNESEMILHGIDLEIKKGELVAIVGPTGTGKSTLVNLLPRFYDPTQGEVTIDGIKLTEVALNSLRDQFSVVTQDTILFNDTVRANINYSHRNATDSKIEEAAKQSYAHDFIAKMPDGYDTKVGDRGFRLSGGEKQRISIARAILKNSPILILDEATSALDSESEKYVQDALDKLMIGRTVIAIAHRLSTVLKADKIVCLESGRIVGIGKHDELLKTCELYKKLHSMQFHV